MRAKKVGSIRELGNEIRSDMTRAARAALTRTAFAARKNAIGIVEKNFTLRNRFTVSSIRATPCRGGKNLADLRSSVGILARASYMARQETGGTRTNPTGANLAIPTTFARGGSNGRKVRASMRLDRILPQVAHSHRKGSHRANLVARAAVAGRMGSRTPYVRIGEGIFRVSSFRKLKSGRVAFRARLVYNLKFRTTETPASPWLAPASDRAARLTGTFFAEEMDRLE